MPQDRPLCGGTRGQYSQYICKGVTPWGCANSIERMRLSFYAIHLAEWVRVFPRENLMFLRLEELYGDKIRTLNRVLKFLDLPPLSTKAVEYLESLKPKNKSKMRIEMLNQTKSLLKDFFNPMNMELSKLLGEAFYIEET